MKSEQRQSRISAGERATLTIFAALLFAYGTYRAWIGDDNTDLHYSPTWAIYGAIVCAGLVLICLVGDRFDRRDNGRHYRAFARGFKLAGWAFFAMSLTSWLFGSA